MTPHPAARHFRARRSGERQPTGRRYAGSAANPVDIIGDAGDGGAGVAGFWSRDDERLRGSLLDSCAKPLQLNGDLTLARSNDVSEVLVAGSGGGLADDGPGDVALGCHEVEIVQIAQQPESAGAGTREDLRV
jgi:hypothetical protein